MLFIIIMVLTMAAIVSVKLHFNVQLNTLIRGLEHADELGHTRKAQWIRELMPGRLFSEGIGTLPVAGVALIVSTILAWFAMPFLPGTLRVALLAVIAGSAMFFLPKLFKAQGVRGAKAIALVVVALLLFALGPRTLPGLSRVDGGVRIEPPATLSPGQADVPVLPSPDYPQPQRGDLSPSPDPLSTPDPSSPPVSPSAPSQGVPGATAPQVPPVIRGRVKDLRAMYPPELYRQEAIPGGGVRVFFAPQVWIDIRGEEVVACNPTCALAQ